MIQAVIDSLIFTLVLLLVFLYIMVKHDRNGIGHIENNDEEEKK